MIESKMRVLGQKKTRGMEGVKCPTPSLFGVKYDIFFIYCLKMIPLVLYKRGNMEMDGHLE